MKQRVSVDKDGEPMGTVLLSSIASLMAQNKFEFSLMRHVNNVFISVNVRYRSEKTNRHGLGIVHNNFFI